MDWVDVGLVVNILDGEDGTLEVAREVLGDKFLSVRCDLPAERFNDMRNFGLREAEKTGCDWAVVLDTDERIELNGVDIRKELAETDCDYLDVCREGTGFPQQRFFRLPAKGHYKYVFHEEYLGGGRRGLLPVCRLRELPHPDNMELQKKYLKGIREQHLEEPNRFRWLFYLGLTCNTLGKHQEALKWFRRSYKVIKQGDVAFHICEQLFKLGKFHECLKESGKFLVLYPDFAEFHLFAGGCCLNLGRFQDAVSWGQMGMGLTWSGRPEGDTRDGEKDLRAYYDGPWWVIAKACEILGDVENQGRAEDMMNKLKEMREKIWGISRQGWTAKELQGR